MVERYAFFSMAGRIRAHNEGEYVRHSDYEALASENEQLRKERDTNGVEAFKLRNQLADAEKNSATWRRLHDQQERRASELEKECNQYRDWWIYG